jgi:hypothetical protein
MIITTIMHIMKIIRVIVIAISVLIAVDDIVEFSPGRRAATDSSPVA